LSGGLYLTSSANAEQAKEVTAEQVAESAIAIAGNGFGRAVLTQIRRNGLEVGKETRIKNGGRSVILSPDRTRMVWVESPTNPLLKLADLAALAEICRGRNLLTVADNTFASPWVQRPLDLGFDIVVHSTTKYLNGHSDVIGGAAVIRKNAELKEQLAFLQNAVGGVPSPFDAFLTLRGIKTLALRMERHCGNAMHIAAWLQEHPRVERVIYPGLASHPQHLLAAKQMNGRYGGMVSAVLKGSLAASRRFLERCKLFTLAESLGGVESLIEHPAIMTHASLPEDVRAGLGISDGLVRLSVGIEDVEDLIAELKYALD
jgi:cystathionine beta-lyase/cystathionine gamma-synthase